MPVSKGDLSQQLDGIFMSRPLEARRLISPAEFDADIDSQCNPSLDVQKEGSGRR